MLGIVEHKDATDDQRAITEINSGIWAFDADVLRAALGSVGTDNSQGEKYLTDVLAIARDGGHRVGAHLIDDLWQTEGVNDRVQLAALGRELNRRNNEKWMREGVTIVDPATTWIDADVTIGRDATILPNTQLLGATSIGADARIGPDTTLTDTEVGEGAEVKRTEANLAVIGAQATVGPFSYLRPGTVARRQGQDRRLRRDQERQDRRRRQGSAPHLRRRRHDRRRRQHRRRDDLRQLRRRQQAPHDDRQALVRRLRQRPRRARRRGRRCLRRGGHHPHR